MELRHLRYFVMAAEERNISRAAARLFVSQPAVSRQIRDLEDELGLQLFDRKPAGLRLTEAGGTALFHAREILRQVGAMQDAVKLLADRKEESIKIGFLPTALTGFLTEAMRWFRASHPKVCVQIFEMSQAEQVEALRNGEIDLALLGAPEPSVRRTYRIETIQHTQVAMLVPDTHRLARRKSVDLAEFATDIFVTLHEKQFPGRPKMMADLFGKAGIQPQVTQKANGLSELLGLVGGGAGVALAPADLVRLPHAGVVFLPLKRPRMTLKFSAAMRREEKRPEIEALIQLMK